MMVIGHCFVFGNLSIQLLGTWWVKAFYVKYQETKFGSPIDELSGLFVAELTEVPIAYSRTIFYPPPAVLFVVQTLERRMMSEQKEAGQCIRAPCWFLFRVIMHLTSILI